MSHALTQTSNVLLVLGLAIVLIGVFVNRWLPALAKWRWFLVAGGVLVFALAIAMTWPSFVAGFREGYQSAITGSR
jgi:hypothetical protein